MDAILHQSCGAAGREIRPRLGYGHVGRAETLAHVQQFRPGFPDHELAARAKWWIADYHFAWQRQPGHFGKAENYYHFQTTRGPNCFSRLICARRGGNGASQLQGRDFLLHQPAGNPQCPTELRLKAAMAAGDAYMARNEPGASNRLSDLDEASSYFKLVLKTFPTSRRSLAWGRLGDCYKELGAVNPKYYGCLPAGDRSPTASSAANVRRNRAGHLAEARAVGKSGAEQEALLNDAEAFLWLSRVRARRRAQDDFFWFQKAGLETAHAPKRWGFGSKARNIYTELQRTPNPARPPSSVRHGSGASRTWTPPNPNRCLTVLPGV